MRHTAQHHKLALSLQGIHLHIPIRHASTHFVEAWELAGYPWPQANTMPARYHVRSVHVYVHAPYSPLTRGKWISQLERQQKEKEADRW